MPGQLSGGMKIMVADFLHAAPVFRMAGDELGRLGESIGGSLAGRGSFWGNDAAGAAFAGTYLKAQEAIFSRLGTAAGAVAGTGDGLQQMAANYGITEATNRAIVESIAQGENSDLNAILSQKVTRPPLPPLAVPGGGGSISLPGAPPTPGPQPGPSPVPPAASGTPQPAPAPSPQPGSKPVPVSGGSLLGEITWEMGVPWPQADQNRLLDAGDLWTRLGQGIRDIMAPANNEAASISANNQGKAVDAFERFWSSYGGRSGGELARLAEGCGSVARACYRYADAVTSAKHKIEQAGAEFAAVLVASTVAAYFTFGATEAAAESIGSILLAAARAALAWLEVDEVPAIAADMITTFSQLGSMALTGTFTTNVGLVAQDLVKTAFGESLPPMAEQLMADLKGGASGAVSGPLAEIGSSAASNVASQLTRIGNAIASGEIKVANPAIAGSFLQLADVLSGPGGKAVADLSANAVTQLLINHELSIKDLTSDFVSSSLADALRRA
jgi:hypothetical protein